MEEGDGAVQTVMLLHLKAREHNHVVCVYTRTYLVCSNTMCVSICTCTCWVDNFLMRTCLVLNSTSAEPIFFEFGRTVSSEKNCPLLRNHYLGGR